MNLRSKISQLAELKKERDDYELELGCSPRTRRGRPYERLAEKEARSKKLCRVAEEIEKLDQRRLLP